MGKKETPSRDPLGWMKSAMPQEEESEKWIGKGGGQTQEPQETTSEGSSDISSATSPSPSSWGQGEGSNQSPSESLLQPQESQKLSELHDRQKVPKFETFPVKLTVRLSDEQLEFLSDLERKIMRSRSVHNRAERITKNSAIRAAINALMNAELNTEEIRDELELKLRVMNALHKGPRG